MVGPLSHFVVSLGLDGKVVSQGTIAEVMSKHTTLQPQIARSIALEEEQIDSPVDRQSNRKEIPQASGKLMTTEEKAAGRVGWPAS